MLCYIFLSSLFIGSIDGERVINLSDATVIGKEQSSIWIVSAADTSSGNGHSVELSAEYAAMPLQTLLSECRAQASR